MTYFKSNEQDIKQHESIYLNHGIVYHSKMMKPFVFPNWKPDWVIHQEENDIFITVQVNLLSVHQRRKLNEILDSMEMMKEDISNMVAFLLLKDRYCIGCLLIDLTVKKGFELMDNELSNLETQVCCGVSRMWVHTTFRRKGYGLKLLHVFKNHYHLKVQDVAFSSLTPQGLKLASRFTDHVYIYCDLND